MWYDISPRNSTCPICKAPLPKNREDWGHRHGNLDYCSHACVMAADRKYKASKEYQEIQSQLATGGYTPPAASRIRHVEEVPEEELDGWVTMIKAGASMASVAAKYGRSYDYVRYHLNKVGMIPLSCKLTPEQLECIRSRARHGTRIADLALEYKTSKETISRIIHEGRKNEHT